MNQRTTRRSCRLPASPNSLARMGKRRVRRERRVISEVSPCRSQPVDWRIDTTGGRWKIPAKNTRRSRRLDECPYAASPCVPHSGDGGVGFYDLSLHISRLTSHDKLNPGDGVKRPAPYTTSILWNPERM
jgi:hypothetical protein